MTGNIYESDRLVNEYLLFHYGTREEILPYSFGPVDALQFPVRSVHECLRPDCLPEDARALDIGCAVGRSTFELARSCQSVIGVDYSSAFIDVARRLQLEGRVDYQRLVVGDIVEPSTAHVPDGIDRSRVSFQVGDAHALPSDLGPFDVVHAANLLCRLRNPRGLLNHLPMLLRNGGQLILTTPNTWLEEFTPKDSWIGASTVSGDPLTTLQLALTDHFRFIYAKDMPFLIREHSRKFQWSVSQASVWVRR